MTTCLPPGVGEKGTTVSKTEAGAIDPRRVLDLPLEPSSDSGETTVRGYLIKLLEKVWNEQEGFSGKRPFGNSGWDCDPLYPLVKAGLIAGSLDEDGYLDQCDDKAGEQLILAAIKALGTAPPAPEIDMHRWYAVLKDGDKVTGVIGVQGRDGLGLYESVEQWERVNG